MDISLAIFSSPFNKKRYFLQFFILICHIFYAVVVIANAGESTDEPRTSRVTSLINGAVGWLADWLADYVTLSALCLVWLNHTAVLRGFP